MILRLTEKLASRLGASRQDRERHSNPYLDWCAHEFQSDRRYILATNTASLFSIILPGAGISDEGGFLNAFVSGLRDFLQMSGHSLIFECAMAGGMGQATFSRIGDRRVMGSMNDLIRLAKIHLQQISPYETAIQLNLTPMSMLPDCFPEKAFTKMSLSAAR